MENYKQRKEQIEHFIERVVAPKFKFGHHDVFVGKLFNNKTCRVQFDDVPEDALFGISQEMKNFFKMMGLSNIQIKIFNEWGQIDITGTEN